MGCTLTCLPACLSVADSYELAEDIAMISLMEELEEMREGDSCWLHTYIHTSY